MLGCVVFANPYFRCVEFLDGYGHQSHLFAFVISYLLSLLFHLGLSSSIWVLISEPAAVCVCVCVCVCLIEPLRTPLCCTVDTPFPPAARFISIIAMFVEKKHFEKRISVVCVCAPYWPGCRFPIRSWICVWRLRSCVSVGCLKQSAGREAWHSCLLFKLFPPVFEIFCSLSTPGWYLDAIRGGCCSAWLRTHSA